MGRLDDMIKALQDFIRDPNTQNWLNINKVRVDVIRGGCFFSYSVSTSDECRDCPYGRKNTTDPFFCTSALWKKRRKKEIQLENYLGQ